MDVDLPRSLLHQKSPIGAPFGYLGFAEWPTEHTQDAFDTHFPRQKIMPSGSLCVGASNVI